MYSHGLVIQFKELSETFALCVSPGEIKSQIRLTPGKPPPVPREGCLVSISAN